MFEDSSLAQHHTAQQQQLQKMWATGIANAKEARAKAQGDNNNKGWVGREDGQKRRIHTHRIDGADEPAIDHYHHLVSCILIIYRLLKGTIIVDIESFPQTKGSLYPSSTVKIMKTEFSRRTRKDELTEPVQCGLISIKWSLYRNHHFTVHHRQQRPTAARD